MIIITHIFTTRRLGPLTFFLALLVTESTRPLAKLLMDKLSGSDYRGEIRFFFAYIYLFLLFFTCKW